MIIWIFNVSLMKVSEIFLEVCCVCVCISLWFFFFPISNISKRGFLQAFTFFSPFYEIQRKFSHIDVYVYCVCCICEFVWLLCHKNRKKKKCEIVLTWYVLYNIIWACIKDRCCHRGMPVKLVLAPAKLMGIWGWAGGDFIPENHNSG